jgi:hypothetical protein
MLSPELSVRPEAIIGKCPPRTRLEIYLKVSGYFFINKSMVGNNFPGAIFGGMGGLTGVVRGKSRINICGQANVSLLRVGNALDEINEFHEHLAQVIYFF